MLTKLELFCPHKESPRMSLLVQTRVKLSVSLQKNAVSIRTIYITHCVRIQAHTPSTMVELMETRKMRKRVKVCM